MGDAEYYVLKVQPEIASFHIRATNELVGLAQPIDNALFTPGYSYWRHGTTQEDIFTYLAKHMLQIE